MSDLCKQDQLESAFELFQRAPDRFGATSLITAFAKQRGDLNVSLQVYKLLRSSHKRPDGFVFQALLNAGRLCKRLGQVVHVVVDDIARLGMQLDDIRSCTVLVKACGDARDAVAARRVLGWLQGDRLMKVKVDDHLGAVLIGMCSKCGLTESEGEEERERGGVIMKLFEELRASGFIPGLASWTALIGAYAAQGSEKAWELFDEMSRAGLRPDRVTFLALLSACQGTAELKRGEALHSHIKQSGIDIDDFLAAALISMYSKCGDINQAREVFDAAPPSKEGEGAIGRWNAMIGALVKARKTEKALQLFDKMVATGLRPNDVTFAVALPACSSIGDLKRGKEIHSLIKGRGLPIAEFLGAALITMYGSCGDIKEAVSVFDEATKRSVSIWNAMIGVLAKCELGKEALKLFDKMTEEGVQPDAITILAALSACGDIGDLKRGTEIHSLIKQRRMVIDDFLGAALISMYSKCGDFRQALRVFDAMEVRTKGSSSWNAVIAALVKEGNDSAALTAFGDMLAARVQPTLVTFLAALSACKEAEMLKKAKEIHSLIAKKGIPIDGFLAAALISMYSRCGDVEEAKRVFENEVRKKRASPNVVDGWNAIIAGLTKQGENAKALAIFADLLLAKVEPDLVTFLAVLPACGNIGALTEGKEIHSLIAKKGMPINDFLGAALIDMYGKTGDMEAAKSLFEEMRRTASDGVSVWTAMIGTYGDHRRTKEALALFEQLASPVERAGPAKLDGVVLVAVLSACSHAGLVDTALEIVKTMQQRYGFPPNTTHHSCVIDALGRANRLEEAETYAEANVPRELVPWKTLLGACRIHGDVERAKRAEQRARALAPRDGATRVLMSNIYASAGQWENVQMVRDQMKEDKVKKRPGISNIEVKGKVHEFFVGDTRHEMSAAIHAYLAELWKKMKAAGT